MRDYSLNSPFELFGYECGPGWYPLIEEAKKIIDDWNKEHAIENGEKLCFSQVKEKFGELTIYLNFYPDDIHKKIIELGAKSLKVCEQCGTENGVTSEWTHGWIFTLCPECRMKEVERWNKLREIVNQE